MTKPRIRVRPLENNCHVIMNGRDYAVIHRTDLKKGGLMDHVQYLRSITCDFTADQILKCIRVN